MSDRMSHVLMLGGMALVGCGGSTLPEPDRASSDATPHELEDAAPADAASTDVTFPFETNAALLDAARLVVESLLEDEIDHGRVGWAYLATRARSASLAGLANALPAMLDRTFGRALRGLGRVEDNDVMEAFGYVRDGACKGISRRALRDVVIPGFETLGVDLSAVRGPVAAWLEGLQA